jgi:uncharacterized protein
VKNTVTKHKAESRKGVAWLLRKLSARFRAYAPFEDETGNKGWFTPWTMPPPHCFKRYQVHRKNIAKPWRIALVADLHTGSFAYDIDRLTRIFAEVNAEKPDLVLLLGDYMNMIGWAKGHIAPHKVASLLRFPAAEQGVFAVLGNHDWEYGFEDVKSALEHEKITVLENALVTIDREGGQGGDQLVLAGLSDDRSGQPDPSILSTVDPSSALLIMAHDPAVFLDVPQGSLMVCGHMHGGQVKLPFLPPPLVPHGRAPRRWASGHIKERGGDLIVSAGLGCSGLPIRFCVPPEIVMLELVPAKN